MKAAAIKKKKAANNNPPLFDEALTLQEQGKHEEAAETYRQCLAQNPRDAAAWSNLGTSLRQTGHLDAAEVAVRRALEIRPGHASYLTNLGNVLSDMDRKDGSIMAHAAAVRAEPDSFLYRKNYACALREFCEFDAALKQLDILLSKEPNNTQLQLDRAMVYLHLGHFEKGWATFEARHHLPEWKGRFNKTPYWKGESLKNKSIIIYAEQGFGDTILCSRYIPMVKMRGGRVILECKKPLHRLFSAIPGIDAMVEPGKHKEKPDYCIAMMSLPGIFKTNLNSIPPLPELFVPDAPPPGAQKLLALAGERLKVGIVWSGSVTFKNNRKRAVKAERFFDFAKVPGVQLYSLQKGPCEEELAQCGGQGLIHEFAPHIDDFADTAAILKELDLVIMTDSSVAHLAGSLGVPVWNLLCYQSYWLYLQDRPDSPWYSSMRFFRQSQPGDWDSVFTQVAAALETRAAIKTTGAKTPLPRPQKTA